MLLIFKINLLRSSFKKNKRQRLELEHAWRFVIMSVLIWVFTQTKHLCVLIHIWVKGEVGAVKPV